MSKGSTLTHKCLPTYIEFNLCICKSLFVAQIKVPLGLFVVRFHVDKVLHQHTSLLIQATFSSKYQIIIALKFQCRNIRATTKIKKFSRQI